MNEWRSIGIEDGELVLRDLGLFNEDEADLENIDVEDLSRLLQVMINNKLGSTSAPYFTVTNV